MIFLPDIHGRNFWRQPAKEFIGKEHFVFLGDYLDPYPDEEILPSEAFKGLQDILKLKNDYPDDVTLLLGNHDLHYLNEEMKGSRFNLFNAAKYRRFFEENAKSFQMAYEANIGGKNYLFTHAGILPGWLNAHELLFGPIEPKNLVTFLNSIWNTEKVRHFLLDALSDVPYTRWGAAHYGSMVWADVTEHDINREEIAGYYQVFGHTMVLEPVITPHFACLDCQAAIRIDENGEFSILQ